MCKSLQKSLGCTSLLTVLSHKLNMCILLYAIVQACHDLLAVTQNCGFTCSVCDWGSRAEAAKEAQRAILLGPSLLLFIWLMLRLQQTHNRRHLLQLCFITSWWLQP